MPLQATSGAASQDAFGGNGVAVVPTYIEDIFSCFLYTGNGSTQTITNGIDLSTKGGLVWIKRRNGANSNTLINSATSSNGRYYSISDLTDEQQDTGSSTFPFTTSGFSLNSGPNQWNGAAGTYASWTFRKQPKFFDVVTYTGNGANRTIAHSLGSVPACIIVKRTDTTADWAVYHRSLANTQYLVLNSTAAAATGATWWNSTTPTSSVFSLGTDATVNASGGTYVAYIFAHDAGGFGLTGTDNVISCGSFTTDGSGNATISLGYEPQWLLVKQSSGSGGFWRIWDTMRGWSVATSGGSTADLCPNSSAAENFGGANGNGGFPTATGFYANGGVFNASQTHIYIAIRRGPMKVPTTGTSVFSPVAKTGDGSTTTVTNVGFPADLFMFKWRSLAYGWKQQDRLRGFPQQLASDATSTESNSGTYTFGTVNNTGYTYGANASTSGELNGSGVTSSVLAFGRAPSFMDVVCYTGTGSNTTVTHNLAAVPELIIVKKRSAATSGSVYSAAIGNTQQLELFSSSGDSAAFVDTTQWNSTTPTSTVFTVGTNGGVNGSGATYVAYLFATCAGVSKVGSYTGTGTTKQIDCGFTGGARFVLIKRTDSTGDWYVWDSARGIVAGNDPYLLLNSTAAEVTNTDYVDTYSAGFEISSTAPAAINANGGTFIFLAIA